jgi:SSS family transporter
VLLGPIDLLVFAGSLALTIVIGIRLSARPGDLDSYLLAGRDLPWWALLGSIVATETSTATVLSVPGLAYGPAGMTFLQLAFGYILGRAIVARVLLPLYFQGRLFSAYEVLGRRFGMSARRAASLLFLVTRNLGDGLRLFLAALVLQQLVGWSFLTSLLTMGATTVVYTYLGGMRSVVWNDCVQLVIYTVGGVAAVFVIAASVPGGWDAVWSYAAEHRKLRIIDLQWSWTQPFTLWAGLIGGAVLTVGTHGTDHMLVQRYLSARNRQDAATALLASGVVVLLQFALFLFIGVELAAYYAHRPEIAFTRTDAVFAHFIVNVFPRNTGLVGLMLAAILAAAMSTLSSSLNSSASAVVNDWYLPWRGASADPRESLRLHDRVRDRADRRRVPGDLPLERGRRQRAHGPRLLVGTAAGPLRARGAHAHGRRAGPARGRGGRGPRARGPAVRAAGDRSAEARLSVARTGWIVDDVRHRLGRPEASGDDTAVRSRAPGRSARMTHPVWRSSWIVSSPVEMP